MLYQVNGTARPVHHASVVVIATNGGFTQPARLFAQKHGIHLIDRQVLASWAIRETSFPAITGMPLAPQSASPPVAGAAG